MHILPAEHDDWKKNHPHADKPATLKMLASLAPGEPYPHNLCFEPELIVRESTIGVHKASPSRPSRGKR